MRRPGLRVGAANSIAVAVAGILWGSGGLYGSAGTAYAQEAPPTTTGSAQTSESLQEVVVTATATGVKKLDASFSIVSADTELIKEANPKSSADILKLSPGIWPESSGGQTGANIEVAGYASGGDSPFFTNMIEGLPLYGSPSLSFMDSSSLFRLDDTIQRVEIVQGGPGAVFGPGQMGATANYILRTGTETPTGSVGLTYGNEDLWRLDTFFGFKIADGWYGSVGGFYRVSDGVRAPEFKADNGGQFTATLKHDLDNGSLMVWTRVLDDKNQFIVPVPLIESSVGSYANYPGFDALTGTFGSRAIQNVTLPNAAGGFQNADLANGRGGQLYYLGIKWEQKFGGWSLSNNFLIDGGGLDTNALFSGPNPRPLSYYLYGCHVAQPGGFCKASTTGGPLDTAVDSNNLNGGQGYDPTLYNISAVYAGSGGAVAPGQSVIQQGWWYIQKSLQNAVDELRVTGPIFLPDNYLTVGLYLADYTDNDNWSLGNQMVMTGAPNATPITLNYLSGGGDCAHPTVGTNVNTCHLTSPQGFVNDNGNFNILEHGDAMNIAAYLSDAWRSGPWLADAGARLEHLDAHQRTCNRTNQPLGSAFDLWDNAVPICNGTWDYEHYVRTRPTFTGGVNYEFASNMSAYARGNTGQHYNDFDNGIRGASTANPKGFAPLQTITNYEVGFKIQVPMGYLDVTAYHRKFTGLGYQQSTITGTPLGIFSTFGATTKGVDFTGYVTPIQGLTLRVVGDYMDGTYEDNNSCLQFTDVFGNKSCIFVNGAPLQRQPKFQIRATPSYTLPGSWGDVTAWVTFEHVGERFEDQSGRAPLGSYNMLGAGILADVHKNWQLRVQGTNLTNKIALTEGNARVFGGAVGIGGTTLVRPYEGREISFTGYYKF